jgi:hypothetical protein
MFELDRDQCRRFWARVCSMGIVRGEELVRIHQMAQARRIAPEGALVSLGILTADQAVAFLNEEAPFGFSMADVGAA